VTPAAPPAPAPPGSVAVLGAGTMGAGMALAFARAGSRVTLVARREASLAKARQRIEEGLSVLHRPVFQMDRTGPDRAGEVLGRIGMTTSMGDVGGEVDLILESIVESVEEKRTVLRAVEDRLDPTAVLATNTSSIPLGELSSGLRRPGRFAGMHWFNPPEMVELVEVVSGPETDAETVDLLSGWARAAGKSPVVIRHDIPGFVANRLQYALIREAYALVEAGVCGVEDVDRVVTVGLGPRWTAVGPFQAMDLAGLDVHRAVAERLFPSLAVDSAPPAWVGELVESGALGAKSGRGLCGSYDEGAVRTLAERFARLIRGVAELQQGGGLR
jgi:3-hydroxybutyryl-CoA dehydrogenase